MTVATTVPAAATVLTLQGVQKDFVSGGQRRAVLAGVDLTLAAGEIVAVSGRSGSGKTTLLTLVAGWEQPDGGRITVHGRSDGLDELRWHEVALLPQSLGLLDELTIAENVELPLRLGHPAASDEVGAVMAELGVDHLARRFPDEVSLGEQQRAALARAAVTRPRLLLADEPISHQNAGWAQASMAVLERLAAGGTACLLATHNELAFESADRVLEVHDGRLRPRSAAR